MKKWSTAFQAIKPTTGEVVTWQGPVIEAYTKGLAQQWCDENAGHLVIDGEVESIIECKPGTNFPDFDSRIDYDVDNN